MPSLAPTRNPTAGVSTWLVWFAAAVITLLAAAGVFLIVRGTQPVTPPSAPPVKPFAVGAVPTTLNAGDTIPPAAGPAATTRAQPPNTEVASTVAATTRTPPTLDDTNIADANDTTPPTHLGPWTFDGADRLFIQSLGVEALIDDVGADQGALVIPNNVKHVGRWTGGANIDSDDGTVLLAGHINLVGQGQGALHNLATIQPGAVIVTTDRTGLRVSWRVTTLQQANKERLPSQIFTATGPKRLVLVTCGGQLLHIDSGSGGYNTYEDNTIVTAVPA